jgi:SET domain
MTTTTIMPPRRRQRSPLRLLFRVVLPLLSLFLLDNGGGDSVVRVVVVVAAAATATTASSSSASTATTTTEQEEDNEEGGKPAHGNDDHDHGDECGLYMAPSQARRVEETTWGIYAGRPYRTGDALGSPELALLLPGVKHYTSYYHPKVGSYLQGLAWSTETVGAQFATDDTVVGKSVALLPGLGLFAGCYMKKRNTKWNITNPYHASSSLSSNNRAMVGAETSFFNIQAVAMNDIAIGSELFFGCGSDDDDDDDEKDDPEVLTAQQYSSIDTSVEKMLDFFARHPTTFPTSSGARQTIYDFFRHDVIQAATVHSPADDKKANIDHNLATKIDRLLPVHVDDLADLIRAGGARSYHDPTIANNPDHATAWLRANGLCLDHVVMAESSTIAGRGVFTTRPLVRGATIAPLPLIHLPNRTVLDMYDDNDDDYDDEENDKDDDDSASSSSPPLPFHRQLLLNYCYVHDESSLLFCPAGPVVAALNHSPTPNAQLAWSTTTESADNVFSKTVDQMWQSPYKERLVLMLQVVALTDLPAGTEVTIDYGRAWEQAYRAHSEQHNGNNNNNNKRWREEEEPANVAAGDGTTTTSTATTTTTPGSVLYANQLNGYSVFSQNMILPDNVWMKAFVSRSQRRELRDAVVVAENDGTTTTSSTTVVELVWQPANAHKHKNLVHVQGIRAVDAARNEYTVEVRLDGDKNTAPTKTSLILTGVSREALILVDAPLTGAQFQRQGFRHPLGFPDELLPAAWRDRAATTMTSEQ